MIATEPDSLLPVRTPTPPRANIESSSVCTTTPSMVVRMVEPIASIWIAAGRRRASVPGGKLTLWITLKVPFTRRCGTRRLSPPRNCHM